MFVSEQETGHTLHNWIELSSSMSNKNFFCRGSLTDCVFEGGRGYVSIKDAASFELDEPWSLNLNATHTTPVYMMSVFHQLHCLVRPSPFPHSQRPYVILTAISHT